MSTRKITLIIYLLTIHISAHFKPAHPKRYLKCLTPNTSKKCREIRLSGLSATAANVVDKSLKSCRQLRSGSRISQVQYLPFRRFWSGVKPPQAFDPTMFNLATEVQQARQMLGNSLAFQNYLAAIGTNASQSTAEFTVPLLQQREV